MKEQFREANTTQKISHITFGMMTSEEMRRQSHINVISNSLYEQNTRNPSAYGVLDLRMGTSSKDKSCLTCGKGIVDCIGHYGFIDLEMPCYHIGFFRPIINVLQCICKCCSRLLLPPEKRKAEWKKVIKPNLCYLEKKAIRKKINEMCRKINKCPYCEEFNGVVKKCALLKIVHDKYRYNRKNEDEAVTKFVQSFSNVMKENKEIAQYLNKTQEALNPLSVLQLFSRIPDQDVPFLMMNRECGRPEEMIISRILVSPLCIRPSVVSEIKAGTTEDDITMRLLDIVQQNRNLVALTQSGCFMTRFMEVWDYLQLQVAQLYNSELSGVPKSSQDTKKKKVPTATLR